MKNLKLFFILSSALLITSCFSIPFSRSSVKNYAVVKVFFATDRKTDSTENIKNCFGVERGPVSYGITSVSIPRDHRMGELESPSIWKLEFRENPEKHVVLLDVDILDKEFYFNRLSETAERSGKKSLFVYIHGYKVTFEDAARRTAQMSYDLSFDGAPVFYSWPSHGSLPKYTFDEVNIKWAQSNIKKFLIDVVTKTEAENIYLIAHSMGNRALTRAYINAVKENPLVNTRIKEIILAAPDIDADIFVNDIAPALAEAGRPVTLYASSEDIPLKASKAFHGGHPRAGDSGDNIIVMEGIETVDASAVKSDFMGHSYYADERSLISDMYYIINYSLRPDGRSGLVMQTDDKGIYWKFRN